ncbi:hypothetical protein A6A25_39315 [Saccharothrix sp. CB00851]|nr:hypothetical protein A6A25_39315 [Saccharothrix sp. CB00851]
MLLSIPTLDAARQLLGQSASQEAVDAKNAELGLDQPVLTRYGQWLGDALTGDLGRSWFTSRSAISRRQWPRSPTTPVTTATMGDKLAVTGLLPGR